MSDNKDFEFDIASILADFANYSQDLAQGEDPGAGPEAPPPPPAPGPEAGLGPERLSAPAAPAPRPMAQTPRRTGPETGKRQATPHRARAVGAGMKGPRQETAPRPGSQPRRSPGPGAVQAPGRRITAIVCAVLSLLSLCWIFMNVHPDTGTVSSKTQGTALDLSARLESFANNGASDALGELANIPKIYAIPPGDTVAPEPDQSKFGSTTDPAEIVALIDSAAALLGDQEMAFDPAANFIPGEPIQYYLDETILAITWKEDIQGKCVSCGEVKIADGSQLRRKIAGDTYSTGVRYYATDMARECNAVIAINGDFYDFRSIGVTAYQGQLYRFAPDKLDSCHFTTSGDMLFSYAGELSDAESTQRFIDENQVYFTASFGPVLVDNGELREISGYPIGELDRTYSRSGIGQLGPLHYFLMTINYADGYTTAGTVFQLGQFLYDKGCQKAYNLDGGQTSILIMNGEAVNHVDYGDERTMSDIIYFATALPEEEAGQ